MSASLTTRSKNPRVLSCLDRSGVSVSTLCAVHCACMPVLVALFPAAGLGILADEMTEVGLLALAVLLGLASLSVGYRVHRSLWVILTVFTGFGLIVMGRVAEATESETVGSALLVGGGLTIAAAHLLSRRLCREPGRCRVGRS